MSSQLSAVQVVSIEGKVRGRPLKDTDARSNCWLQQLEAFQETFPYTPLSSSLLRAVDVIAILLEDNSGENSSLVGFCAVVLVGLGGSSRWEAYIQALHVAKRHRRHGLGSELLAAAIVHCASNVQGLERVRLHTMSPGPSNHLSAYLATLPSSSTTKEECSGEEDVLLSVAAGSRRFYEQRFSFSVRRYIPRYYGSLVDAVDMVLPVGKWVVESKVARWLDARRKREREEI